MSAAWLPTYSPWSRMVRAHLNILPWSTRVARFIPTNLRASKTFFNSSITSQEHPSMIEMRNRPYPTTGWDTSLFEEPLESKEVAQDHGHYVHRPCSILARSVERGDLEEAYTIREELERMGVSIQPDQVYEQVAVQAAFSEGRFQGDIAAFMSWWTLVPQPLSHEHIWKCQSLRSAVLQECLMEDAHRMIMSVLHATYRGHSGVARRLLLSRITTSSSLAFITAFLHDLCSAERFYLQSQLTDKELAATVMENCSTFCNQALAALTRAGRVEDAAQLVIRTHALGLWIAHDVYRAIDTHLDDFVTPGTARQVQKVAAQHGVTLSAEADEAGIRDRRELHHAFVRMRATLGEGKLPPVRDLRHYIQFCYSIGNYQALNSLRQLYHRSARAHLAVSFWAREEMIHFMKAGQKDAVLAVFFKYFRSVGTPRPELIAHIKDEFHRLRSTPRNTAKGAADKDDMFMEGNPVRHSQHSDAFGEAFIPAHLTSSDSTFSEKLEPTRYHNIFVWTALVRMASWQTLQPLYTEFLSMVVHAQSNGLSTSPNLLMPGDNTALFDTIHFNTFIRAFCLRGRAKQAVRILSDMDRLGVKPDVETYTTLLRPLKGNPTLSQRILRHAMKSMRQEIVRPGRGVASIRARNGAKGEHAMHVLFTAALQTALDNGAMDQAGWISRQLCEVLGYYEEDGKNRIVNATLARFSRERIRWFQTKMKPSTEPETVATESPDVREADHAK